MSLFALSVNVFKNKMNKYYEKSIKTFCSFVKKP